MRRVTAALAVLTVLLPTSVSAAPVPADPAALAGGELLRIVPGPGAQVRTGAQVRSKAAGATPDLIRGDGGFAGKVPDRAAFRFLGAPGSPVWTLAPASGDLPAIDATAVPGRRR